MEQPRSEKWNKQMSIFEKRGSFGAVQVEKVESLGAAHAEKWGGGAFGRHIQEEEYKQL